MRVRLVEIVSADDSFKGTWYRRGQRHYVVQDAQWPQVMACRWRALSVSGGIHEADCREVTGFRVRLACMARSVIFALTPPSRLDRFMARQAREST